MAQLDWGIAGTSSSQALPNGHVFSKWAHWIDSRFRRAEEASDEGDMVDLDDGTTLETGRMVNPDTGRDTEYEEIWADETPAKSPAGNVCVVLKHEDAAAESRGLVVQLGGYCQGLVRVGSAVALERWQVDAGQFKRTVRLGDAGLRVPCQHAASSKVTQGAEMDVGGRKWTVVEVV